MKIVIKIPEDAYDYLINTSFKKAPKIMFNQSAKDGKHTTKLFDVIDAIKNGTPLPKGHGRLIDADRLKIDNPLYLSLDIPYVTEDTVEEIIDHAPTILEADKEGNTDADSD